MEYREKEICTLLDEKSSLFQRYLSATKRIKEAFVGEGEGKGNPGVFIAERQSLIERIEKIDKAVERVIKSDASHGESGSFSENIETRLQDIKAMMERVKPMDEALMAMVREGEEQAKKALLKMQKSRNAVNGYQRMGKFTPRFFDELR